MVLASDKAHSQNIRFIRGINFSVFFSKNRKESFLRWLGAAFPAPLCVPLVCPASGRCPQAPLSDRLGEWMPRHTPGTNAGRRLRRKRNFRRRAGTDQDRAQALWEMDRADTGSERIRQRSGRNSSFDRAFPGVFPYARRVPRGSPLGYHRGEGISVCAESSVQGASARTNQEIAL